MKPYVYEVIDRHTGKVVGRYMTKVGARRAVDKLDNAYGGYRYRAQPIKGAMA